MARFVLPASREEVHDPFVAKAMHYKVKPVLMAPREYLRRAAKFHPDPEAFLDEEALHRVKSRLTRGEPLDPPYLEYETGKYGRRLVSQEGRHRALAAQQLGIEEIPVLVIEEELS